MKSLVIALLTVSSFSAFAFDCKQNEAQFIGKVAEYKKEHIDQYIFDCSYKIEFSRFDSSIVCPLDISEVYDVRFEDTNCSLKNGDDVSGYLVQDLKTGSVVIE